MGPFPWMVTLHPCRKSAALPLNTVPWSLWTKATPLASWGPQDGGSTQPLRPWVGLIRVGGKQQGQPLCPTHEPGCSGGCGGSGSFPCRGTDELLGVMDQVTIINSTLGKALGGASGACWLGPLGSLYLHARPWRGLEGGGKGRPGAAGKKTAWTVLSGGLWGKLWLLVLTLVLRGLHDRAWGPGVPATAAGPALPLLQQSATCFCRLCLQGPGPAHGEQCHRPVYGGQDPAVRCGPGQGGASWGEGASEGLPCVPAQAHNSLPLHPASAHLCVPRGLHWNLALLTMGYLLALTFFSLFLPFLGTFHVCLFFIFFGPTACGILAPQPRIEPMPPALEVWSINHWTPREVSPVHFFANDAAFPLLVQSCLSASLTGLPVPLPLSPSASLGQHLCLCWSLLQIWSQALGRIHVHQEWM